MQFLYPWFLLALAALSIPVIIHLFNFRRFKTVYFSNVKFLKEVKEETASRNRLKHLLVLASRILALTFLVLAFAQPFIPGKQNAEGAGKKNVSIFIDNSFSMSAMNSGRSLFDKARETAKEIAGNFSAEDEFQLLTNDFEGKHQRLVGKDEFLTMLNELEISPAVRTLSDITRRQQEALSRNNQKNQATYVLSDFQKNMGDFSPDSLVNYHLIPLAGDAQNNVYIDSVWFAEPVQVINRQLNLVVKTTNSGNEDAAGVRLALKLNGQTKTMSELNLEAGSSRQDTLSFITTQSGLNEVEMSISDYPITYDDTYFAVFKVIDKMNVLAINGNRSNQFLEAMFNYQAEFSYRSVSEASVPSDSLSAYELIVLNELKSLPAALRSSLNTYVAGGGSVAVFPAGQCDLESYNRFLNSMQASSITGFTEQAQDIAGINVQQNVFKDVFEKIPDNLNLPVAKKYYQFSRSTASNEEAILTLKDGTSFLSRFPYDKGSLYLCGVPLDKDFSTLPVHAIFVPMMFQMAVQSIKAENLAYFIGDKTRIEVEAPKSGGEKVYKIYGQQTEFIPEQYTVGNKILLGLGEGVKKPGFFQVGISKTEVQGNIALNYDRKESNLSFFTAAELSEKYNQPNVKVVDGAKKEVATVVKELDRGTPLWKHCLVLVLIFLGIEIALLRFWKV